MTVHTPPSFSILTVIVQIPMVDVASQNYTRRLLHGNTGHAHLWFDSTVRDASNDVLSGNRGGRK
jgi:hypothetical protein